MTYDLEKYRDKREKVLGVKKRGVNFGTIAALVSFVIIMGLGVVVIPKSVAFFNNLHLDDAIYKLRSAETWPQEVIPKVNTLPGVKNVITDSGGARIVVTFDRSITDTSKLTNFFKHQGLQAVMLNKVSHSQRLKTLKKEAEFENL